MPLYKIDHLSKTFLVYAKTRRGAQNHILNGFRENMSVSTITPLEAALLAGSGVKVETAGKGPDVIMDDPPPEAKRGFVPGAAAAFMNMAETMLASAEGRDPVGETLAEIERERREAVYAKGYDDPIPPGEENPTVERSE